jgi:hypothetical protein
LSTAINATVTSIIIGKKRKEKEAEERKLVTNMDVFLLMAFGPLTNRIRLKRLGIS